MQNEFVLIKNQQMLKRIEFATLYAIICDGYCSTFFMDNQEKFTCCKTLKEIENLIRHPIISYHRINKNTIVNLSRVAELLFEERTIELDNVYKYKVSVRKMKNIKMALTTIKG